MSDEQKGWCSIQITKLMLDGVLDGPNQDKCAQVIGYLVANAIRDSRCQPCTICRIDIVEIAMTEIQRSEKKRGSK